MRESEEIMMKNAKAMNEFIKSLKDEKEIETIVDLCCALYYKVKGALAIAKPYMKQYNLTKSMMVNWTRFYY